ncbi:MAG: M56 family metallopeptidase [Anaerolineales bacterium]
MNVFLRFLLYNYLISLAGGLLVWVIVRAAVHALKIRSSALSFCFLGLAVFKSLLLLMGIGLVFPWPADWFGTVYALAVPPAQVLPYFLIWSGGVYLIFYFSGRNAIHTALADARPAAEAGERLAPIFDRVLESFRNDACRESKDDFCSITNIKSTPRLMVSERIRSPMALTGEGEAAVIFPKALVSRLTDAELEGALAHELAHFVMRRPSWCSAGTLLKMAWMIPTAFIVGESLRRQEETACDDLAVSIVGRPDCYSGMLTKCYRFARGEIPPRMGAWMEAMPRLIGYKPLLTERVEHLVGSGAGQVGRKPPVWLVWTVWVVLLAVLLFHN